MQTRKFVGSSNHVNHYKTEYYIYFDEEKLKVNFDTYNSIEMGDEFMIEEVSIYKTDDGSRILEKRSIIIGRD